MSGFLIDLPSLPRGTSRVEVESEALELGLPQPEWPGRIRGELDLEKNGEQVSVRGRLIAVARLECVRCLREYELPLRVPFELFAERAGTGRRRDEQALERDSFMKFHDGRRLDLREEARETLLLEIPMSPHCREDCAGLCPRCGADRNDGPCGCPPDHPT